MPGHGSVFTGVRIFSSSTDRDGVGDRVTAWLLANPAFRVSEVVGRQSSDAAFHCLTIIVFYRTP